MFRLHSHSAFETKVLKAVDAGSVYFIDVWYFRQKFGLKKLFFAEKLFSLMKTSDIFAKNLVKKTFFAKKLFFPDEDVWYFRRKFG